MQRQLQSSEKIASDKKWGAHKLESLVVCVGGGSSLGALQKFTPMQLAASQSNGLQRKSMPIISLILSIHGVLGLLRCPDVVPSIMSA